MANNHLQPLTPIRTVTAMVSVSVAVLVATAWWWGSDSQNVWIAAAVAAGSMFLVCLASLEVMLRMTKAGHGIAGVFAGMLVRLAGAMTLVLSAPAAVPQITSLPILSAGLVHMLMLNYLAGLAVETIVAARLATEFQPTPPTAQTADGTSN